MKKIVIIILFGTFILFAQTLKENNEKLLNDIKKELKITDAEYAKLKNIFIESRFMGQGNPAVTKHAMTKEECQAIIKKTPIQDNSFETICKAPHMAPLYNPATEKPESAKVCIDQFEFPNIACEYPVVWVRASEAELVCRAIGKRLCDAHEWEGACAGALLPPDYHFDLLKNGMKSGEIHTILRNSNNKERTKVWAYGKNQNHKLCATGSSKSSGCDKANQTGVGVYQSCGSNTYPAGAFPMCKSALGVYDQHGNAAEHMNLPYSPSEMTIKNGTGHTEMKGSWFVFQKISAHEDDCRWRSPDWHGSKVMDKNSHFNYHLGFRCCKDL